MRPIVFYYPSRVLGGTEVLFARLAAHLHVKHRLEVGIVDYPDGAVISGTENGVQRLEIGASVPEDACVIVPLSHVRHAYRTMRFNPDTRLMLWSLHPHNLRWLFPGHELWRAVEDARLSSVLRAAYPRAHPAVRESLRLALEHHGLAAMDGENRRALEQAFNLSLASVPLLPIPLPPAPAFAVTHGARLTWLGRVSEDKIHALERVLNEADAYARTQRTRLGFDVIGSGPLDARLRDARRWPNLELRLLGTLTGATLENHLRHEASAVFAMGTSLLEAARLGLPAVLVDVNFQPLPTGLPFRWAFEIEDYTLGQLVSRRNPPTRGTLFPQIMQALSDPAERERLARACQTHVREHHCLETIGTHAARLFDSSRLTVAMLERARLFG